MREKVSCVREEGRNRRVAMGETSSGDQSRRWRPYPTEMVQVLVCSARERGNKKPSWFLFWRGRGLGLPLTILCVATLFIWSRLFPFCLCTLCCYSHSPCFVILVLEFAASKHHVLCCLHSRHTCLVLTSYTPIIVNSTHHVFCWP